MGNLRRIKDIPYKFDPEKKIQQIEIELEFDSVFLHHTIDSPGNGILSYLYNPSIKICKQEITIMREDGGLLYFGQDILCSFMVDYKMYYIFKGESFIE